MARKKGRFNAIKAQNQPAQPVPDKIFHTALYARLSVELAGRPSSSIESQLDIMRSYVKEHPDLDDFREYTDSGYSGTNFNRPAFMKMMEDVKDGRINCIIVKDLSRFGRDYLETTNYIEIILPFLGVRFISVNDHFDTDAANNENKALEIALKNLVNDMYAKDVSKRVAVVRRQEMERGRFTGSSAPYGYRIDKEDPLRRYVIDEPAAAVVRDIYRMAADGISIRQISLALQDRNLSIPGQYLRTGHLYQEEGDPVKIWHTGTIGNILRNSAYIGDLVNGRRKERLCENEKRHFTDQEEWLITKNAHEPIVDRETYDKVRSLFAQKVADSSFSSDRGKDIPVKEDKYHHLLFCGKCGKHLQMCSRLWEHDGRVDREYFYQCNHNYDVNHPGYCGVSIREWKLDRAVYAAMKAQIEAVVERQDLVSFCESVIMEKLQPLERETARFQAAIEKIEYEGSRRYEEYVTGRISREQMERLQKESADKVKKLTASLDDAQERYTRRKKELDGVMRAVKAVYRMNGRGAITQELLRLMVERIVVFPDGHLEIQWQFTEWFDDVSAEYGKGRKNDEEMCDVSAALEGR